MQEQQSLTRRPKHTLVWAGVGGHYQFVQVQRLRSMHVCLCVAPTQIYLNRPHLRPRTLRLQHPPARAAPPGPPVLWLHPVVTSGQKYHLDAMLVVQAREARDLQKREARETQTRKSTKAVQHAFPHTVVQLCRTHTIIQGRCLGAAPAGQPPQWRPAHAAQQWRRAPLHPAGPPLTCPAARARPLRAPPCRLRTAWADVGRLSTGGWPAQTRCHSTGYK